MTDITASVLESQVGRSDDSVGRWVCKKITPVADSVSAVATHNLITMNANEFFAFGFVVIVTSLASTSNTGTIQFQVAGETYSALLVADGTELVAKDVIMLVPNDKSEVAGPAGYVTATDAIDMDVATNALTAGVFYIVALLVDLTEE